MKPILVFYRYPFDEPGKVLLREGLWIAKLRHLNLFVLDNSKFGHDPLLHHVETVVARHSERHNIARVPFLVEVEERLADARL